MVRTLVSVDFGQASTSILFLKRFCSQTRRKSDWLYVSCKVGYAKHTYSGGTYWHSFYFSTRDHYSRCHDTKAMTLGVCKDLNTLKQ